VGNVGVAGLLDPFTLVPSVAKKALLHTLTPEHPPAPGALCAVIFTTTVNEFSRFPLPSRALPGTIIRSTGSAVWSTENCALAADAGAPPSSTVRSSHAGTPDTRWRCRSPGSPVEPGSGSDSTLNTIADVPTPGSPSHNSTDHPSSTVEPLLPLTVAAVPAMNSTRFTSIGKASFTVVVDEIGSGTRYVLPNPSPTIIPACSVISPPVSTLLNWLATEAVTCGHPGPRVVNPDRAVPWFGFQLIRSTGNWPTFTASSFVASFALAIAGCSNPAANPAASTPHPLRARPIRRTTLGAFMHILHVRRGGRIASGSIEEQTRRNRPG
jgi:hypothetical protein